MSTWTNKKTYFALDRWKFLVKLLKVGPFEEVYGLQNFLHLRVLVCTLELQPGPLQCFNCQRFGHCSLFWNHPPHCVRCATPHRGCCKPTTGFMAICCNCGDHPANYRGSRDFIAAMDSCSPWRAGRPCCRSSSQPVRGLLPSLWSIISGSGSSQSFSSAWSHCFGAICSSTSPGTCRSTQSFLHVQHYM